MHAERSAPHPVYGGAMFFSAAEREERIVQYERGPLRIRDALAVVPDEAVRWRPRPERWSVHEVVCHCADSEMNGAARIRYLVAQKEPTILGYEKDSGTRVVLNVGASSDLARQILAGAGADLFFSADRAQMDVVEKAGLVRGSDRVELLSNVLVVVVPADAPTRVGSPADLALLRRIALADPEAVPAGVYAWRYLVSIGLCL